ncbi:MAG TPA: hypothetical protein VGS19_09760 [Streptosporangiaceae bacterium]|nr:hypothetical protein [Streptosporangiaceae bacterium]
MITLGPLEQEVRRYLIERATQADPEHPLDARITYGELCQAVDPEEAQWRGPRYRGIGETLGHISAYEVDHGQPMLSALVVRHQTRRVGDGFIPLARSLGRKVPEGEEEAFWLREVQEVVRFWGQPNPLPRVIAMLDTVISEVAEIKRLLGHAT